MPGHLKHTYPEHVHITLDVRQFMEDPDKRKGGAQARARSTSPGPSRKVKGDLDFQV